MARHMSPLGIDIVKPVFHAAGLNGTGHVMPRKRMASG